MEVQFPYIASELSARLLSILADPLHRLYGKANTFMNKAPVWEIAKIPSYWIDKILMHESEYDDSHYEEVSWLLDLFVNGLRTEKVGQLPSCCYADAVYLRCFQRIWISIVVPVYLNGCFPYTIHRTFPMGYEKGSCI